MFFLYTVLGLSILVLFISGISVYLCLKDFFCEPSMTKIIGLGIPSVLGIAWSLDRIFM